MSQHSNICCEKSLLLTTHCLSIVIQVLTKVTKNDDFWANHQDEEQRIWRLSRFSRLYHRHRVGIPPPIHTRGSEDSVSCTSQTPSNYYYYSFRSRDPRRPLRLKVSKLLFHITDHHKNIMLREREHKTLQMRSENPSGISNANPVFKWHAA